MKFTCREVTELLIDYIENALPLEQKLLLQRHICACPPCMVYMRTYEMTIRMTHRMPAEPLPDEFERRLRAVLEAELSQTPGEASEENG